MYNHKKYQKEWRESHKKYKKEWFQKNKGRYKQRARNDHLIKTYGITIEQYNELFIKQNGCCRICNRHQSEFKRSLAVDHDHKTNKIRGLLCHHCNRGLGDFFEDISIMESAITYIKETSN